MDQLYISLILGAVIVLAVFLLTQRHLIQAILSGNSISQNEGFLIFGLNGTGKTSLFQLMTTGTIPKYGAVMTQRPNEVNNFQIVDASGSGVSGIKDKLLLREYPGHPKLINLFLYRDLKQPMFLKKLKGIIMVVDSSNLREAETAKLLFDVLNFTEFLPTGVDTLIACNKQDLFQSKPIFKIREILELELNKLIQKQTQNLDKVNNDNDALLDNDQLTSSSGGILSSINGKFRFDQLEGNLDFVEGSVLKNKIDKWECWMAERAVN